MKFTEKSLREILPQNKAYKLSDQTRRGEGTLFLKVLPDGRKDFYFRYRHNKTDRTIKIGRFKSNPSEGGLSLKEAREKAHSYSKKLREVGDLKKHLEKERFEKDKEDRQGSFENLLRTYIDKLYSEEKVSAKNVEYGLEKHVIKGHPKIAKLKANEIDSDHIHLILATMVEGKITREVNKVRSYLNAAFTYGGKADRDPRRFGKTEKIFNIKSNPVSMVMRVKEFDKASERVLDKNELKLYWDKVQELTLPIKSSLELSLFLGGQRLTMLTRAKWEKFDMENKILHLYDKKGKGKGRDHLLPLSDRCIKIINKLKPWNENFEWPLTSTGEVPVPVDSLSKKVNSISKILEREHGIKSFTLKDIRRTCETMLASQGIPRDLRAHLLSHGRSGVQETHYDKYSYLQEKKEALFKWERYLDHVLSEKNEINSGAKVIPFPQK
jgi:integrase